MTQRKKTKAVSDRPSRRARKAHRGQSAKVARLTLSDKFAIKDAVGALMDLTQDIHAGNTLFGKWCDDDASLRAKTEHDWLLALVDRLNRIGKGRHA